MLVVGPVAVFPTMPFNNPWTETSTPSTSASTPLPSLPSAKYNDATPSTSISHTGPVTYSPELSAVSTLCRMCRARSDRNTSRVYPSKYSTSSEFIPSPDATRLIEPMTSRVPSDQIQATSSDSIRETSHRQRRRKAWRVAKSHTSGDVTPDNRPNNCATPLATSSTPA